MTNPRPTVAEVARELREKFSELAGGYLVFAIARYVLAFAARREREVLEAAAVALESDRPISFPGPAAYLRRLAAEVKDDE